MAPKIKDWRTTGRKGGAALWQHEQDAVEAFGGGGADGLCLEGWRRLRLAAETWSTKTAKKHC